MSEALDEKGLNAEALDAALAAFKEHGWSGMPAGFPSAVRAYMSALPSSSMEGVAWECTDLIMGSEPSIITDVDHAKMRELQPQAWKVEELVRRSAASGAITELEVEIERLAAENEQLIEAAKKDWAKHGGSEIALGQWKARAEAAEQDVERLKAELGK